MTPPNPLTDLAARVQALTSACREVDCLIFESGHRLLTPERRGTIDGEPTGQYFDLSGNQLPERAPFYTASLDAAMTLLPEGWTWSADASVPGWQPQFKLFNAENKSVTGQAATPALALLSAILRARAALENSHG